MNFTGSGDAIPKLAETAQSAFGLYYTEWKKGKNYGEKIEEELSVATFLIICFHHKFEPKI